LSWAGHVLAWRATSSQRIRYSSRMPDQNKLSSVRPRRPASMRLGAWSRVGVTTLGLAGLGSGAVAVFKTHLEAGPVGLLAVGFLLLLIGMSGRMPSRLKVGDNEAEWQEEREAVQEFVEQVAVDSQESRRVNLIEALDELAKAAPEVANPALSAMAYEPLVMETIAELAREPVEPAMVVGALSSVPNFAISPQGGRHGPVDAILEAEDGTRIAVEIKAYRSGLSWTAVRQVYGNFLRLRETQGDIQTLLLISRTEPRGSVRDMLSDSKEIRLVILEDAKNAAALRAAINSAFNAARS
jgi:hypothetical protein